MAIKITYASHINLKVNDNEQCPFCYLYDSTDLEVNSSDNPLRVPSLSYSQITLLVAIPIFSFNYL